MNCRECRPRHSANRSFNLKEECRGRHSLQKNKYNWVLQKPVIYYNFPVLKQEYKNPNKGVHMLELADLSLTVSTDEYNDKMKKYQYKLVSLQQKIRAKKIPVLIMFEGWDASGKGGCIKRITEGLDPRGVRVWPIGAPNETEQQYHYLWRFWKDIPAAGQIVIFDRSWYGRVLVERVEKITPTKIWKKGYEEIRNLETTLTDNNTVLVKFWIQISKDEQLRRFKRRESDPIKQWKIGPDDWRNRDKWSEYENAAEDMFKETHRPHAPWNIISAECKNYARLETSKILINAIEEKIKQL